MEPLGAAATAVRANASSVVASTPVPAPVRMTTHPQSARGTAAAHCQLCSTATPPSAACKHCRIDKCIGKGSYGRVYKVLVGPDAQPWALKVMKAEENDARALLVHHTALVEVHASCNARGVLLPVRAWVMPASHALVVQCPLAVCNLQAFCNITPPSFGAIAAVAKRLACTLARIHERGFMHRDVSARNVLVQRDGTVLLCDRSLVRRLWGKQLLRPCYTPKITAQAYRAPEVMANPKRPCYDDRVDVWALGCVLMELVTQDLLFEYDETQCEEHLAAMAYACGHNTWPADAPTTNAATKRRIRAVLADSPRHHAFQRVRELVLRRFGVEGKAQAPEDACEEPSVASDGPLVWETDSHGSHGSDGSDGSEHDSRDNSEPDPNPGSGAKRQRQRRHVPAPAGEPAGEPAIAKFPMPFVHLLHFIERCLVLNPRTRATAAELRDHPLCAYADQGEVRSHLVMLRMSPPQRRSVPRRHATPHPRQPRHKDDHAERMAKILHRIIRRGVELPLRPLARFTRRDAMRTHVAARVLMARTAARLLWPRPRCAVINRPAAWGTFAVAMHLFDHVQRNAAASTTDTVAVSARRPHDLHVLCFAICMLASSREARMHSLADRMVATERRWCRERRGSLLQHTVIYILQSVHCDTNPHTLVDDALAAQVPSSQVCTVAALFACATPHFWRMGRTLAYCRSHHNLIHASFQGVTGFHPVTGAMATPSTAAACATPLVPLGLPTRGAAVGRAARAVPPS